MVEADVRKGVKEFEKALKLLFSAKYEQAGDAFASIAKQSEYEPLLIARAETFVALCRQRITSSEYKPETYEDFIAMTVLSLNQRKLDKAESYLAQARKMDAGNEQLFYLEAILACDRHQHEKALAALTRAIELEPLNIIRARNDSDLNALKDVPGFKELLDL